jgi:hypothetical protein
MPRAKLNSIDDYDVYLTTTIAAWTAQQRVALAAAMAERWLHTYEEFSASEKWGDAAGMRHCLDAIWNHLHGRPLSRADLARYTAQVDESTPHMDDFDAYEALAACAILSDALRCCGTANNTTFAVRAALSGFEAAVPEWELDPDEQPRLWRRIAARKELSKQLLAVEQIGAITVFDDAAIKALRKAMTGAKLSGEITPAEVPSGPPLLTNAAAFDQYHRVMESRIKGATPIDPKSGPYIYAIMLYSVWASRYGLRRDAISGGFGRMADTAGLQALMTRQKARDASARDVPQWGEDAQQVFELAMRNSFNFDAKSIAEAHSYGPSLRYLWAEATRAGKRGEEAWQHIITWSRQRPAVWEAEDKRKKKGLAYSSPAMGTHLAREIAWSASGDLDYPWTAQVDGEQWRVWLNDFPDAIMYSLIIGADIAGDFHDWPETWRRE